ncbi:TerB family tellurite resistance protein [Nioella sp.]
MSFVSWIVNRTPSETTPGPDITITVDLQVRVVSSDNAAFIEDVDEDSSQNLIDPAVGAKTRFDLEPMYIGLNYTSASGVVSDRLVTCRYIDASGGHRYLGAMCHARKSFRCFRIDRINYVYDTSGEIFDTEDFFSEILEGESGELIEQNSARRKSVASQNVQRRSTASPYTCLRREILPGLVLLCAAARVDEELHPEEVDRIIMYCEREGMSLEREGVIQTCPDLAAFDKLGRLILRTRPTQPDIIDAIDAVTKWPSERMDRLRRALSEVVVADGVICNSEDAFLRKVVVF